jgi:hypothetical protein
MISLQLLVSEFSLPDVVQVNAGANNPLAKQPRAKDPNEIQRLLKNVEEPVRVFAASGTLVFANGEVSKTFSIRINNDGFTAGTFGVFLIVILGATDPRAPAGFAPLAIGLALTLIHLVSIPITNTSVNPARSTGPAIIVGGWALQQLWLFWIAPIVGAVAAGGFWRWLK